MTGHHDSYIDIWALDENYLKKMRPSIEIAAMNITEGTYIVEYRYFA